LSGSVGIVSPGDNASELFVSQLSASGGGLAVIQKSNLVDVVADARTRYLDNLKHCVAATSNSSTETLLFSCPLREGYIDEENFKRC